MKKILTLLLVSIFHISCFSQTIFPDDIQKIITDEKLFGNEILKFNEFYISNLDLKKINDSLFFNNKTKETLSLSRLKKTNKIYGIINYLTIGSHWNDFKKDLKDFNITNLTDNTFIAEYKKYKDYKIELLKDSLIENQKMKHIRFSFVYEKKENSGKSFFPIKKIYSFLYSEWYFDLKFESDKKYTYYPKIILTKEKTNNKIEFLDRKNMLISYVDENNKQQKVKGTYNSFENGIIGGGIYSSVNGPSIGFRLENSSMISKKLFLHESVDFSKVSTKDFLEFIFNMDFHISQVRHGFELSSIIELNPELPPDYKRYRSKIL